MSDTPSHAAPISCPDSPAYRDASRAQARAADPAHSAWVSANAGSGKTKVLIDRVARLLLKGAAPDSILCVTYTKAAANEMLQRLFGRLGSWSVMAEDTLRAELTQLEDRAENPYTDEEIKSARALFAKALETPGGLRIETIHAFCSRILRRFPLEANIAPGFREIDEDEAALLWEAALEAGLARADETMPALLDAVSLAGGGSGAMAGLDIARTNITTILDFADQHGREPERMEAALRAALSPPDQSEDELIETAMGKALPVKALGQAVEIFEADGGVGSKANATRLRVVFLAQTPTEKWNTYRQVFFTGTGGLRKSIATKAVLKDPLIATLFQTKEIPEGSEVLRIKALDADLKAARLFARTRALVLLAVPMLAAYREAKQANAAIDFDDLIAFTHALLTQKDAASWVLYKLDGGLTHVLLDEAQDTSPKQWGLLNALTEEFFAGKSIEKAQDPRTLFVVGDEKQSIYSFQGADPQQFLSERQSFTLKAEAAFNHAETPDMLMSFRSSPEILQFVDKIATCGEVDGHPYIAGPIAEANLTNHTARRANQAGCVELWPIDVPTPEDEAIPWHAPRDTQNAASPKNKLAASVATEIETLLARKDMIWAEDKNRQWALRPAGPGDVLILVNTRTGGLFDAIIEALKSRNIPVAGADRLVLADHIGVQDCLNLMRFALLPEDDLTLAEILRGPFGGLVDDDRHLFALAFDRGHATLWQRLQASPDPAHALLTGFLSDLLVRAHMPAYEFLSTVLNTATSESNTAGKSLTGWEKLAARLGAPMRDPVQALLSRAMAYDAQSAASLQGFVASMETDNAQIKRDLAAANGEVRVMTVHGAKGLQAPIVILPDTTSGPKPARPSIAPVNSAPVWIGKADDDTPAAALAREDISLRNARERRRLLYVALTRAQDRLIIMGAWHGPRPKPESDKAPGSGCHDQSWYALCSEAMEGLLGDMPEADNGRPAFARYGAPAISGKDKAHSADQAAPLPAWLTRPAPPETSTSRVAAPSALVPGQTPVLPPLGQDRADRLKRGRLIHALLERLPALPHAEREAAGAAFLARDIALTPAQTKDMLGAAMGVLTDPAFDEVFVEGGRAEAPIIGTAPSLPDGLIINGRVDRLVVSATEVLIIDFKTDRPPPKRAKDVGLSYLAQMGAYACVLAEAYPKHKIRAALVWTDGPKLMELPSDLLAGAISQSRIDV